MEQDELQLATGRAQTDESLDAERATSDVDNNLAAAGVRRELDDLIERDRILADSRLLKFRHRADSRLARERAESPYPNSAVTIERELADRGRMAERENNDVQLERERLRSDVAVEEERKKHDTFHVGLKALRQATDEQLSTEREGADLTVTALGETRTALALSHGEQVRRDDVLGIVTHDLRSPLSVISMNAQSIAETTQEPSTRQAAVGMSRAVARMERLLMDLLDVARIQSGTLHIFKEPHDVRALVLEVLNSYGPLFTQRGIAFTINTPADSITFPFDYDRVVQVLSNLLGNAMKFTPRGGAVGLRIERQPDMVEFALEDNGPGIHPAALPHVFERFWQIDQEVRRGLGLGLHICEKIVQAHGGAIRAESEFGKGATFVFTLPVA